MTLREKLKKFQINKLSKEEEKNQKEEILQFFYVKSARIHIMNQLLKAKDVVIEGQVKIVDKQTGRIMKGHRFYQTIYAKENVKIEEENQTLDTITLHNFF